jgi:hypothetical protein
MRATEEGFAIKWGLNWDWCPVDYQTALSFMGVSAGHW